MRVKKVYHNVFLPLHHLPDFSRLVAEQGEYDYDSDVEDGEVLFKVVPQVPIRVENIVEPQV